MSTAEISTSVIDSITQLPATTARPLDYTDYLARSVHVHRVWTTNSSAVSRWHELDLVIPDQEDHACATEIRQYYQSRLLMRVLKSGKTSRFAQDLYQLLNHSMIPTTAHLGMIYRLPYFYYEDLARDRLKERFAQHQPKFLTSLVSTVQTQVLSPVERVLRSRQRLEVDEYWFANCQQQPVVLTVQTGNSLKHLIDGLFKWPTLSVSGHFTPGRIRGTEITFYQLYQFDLVQPVPQ